MYINKIILTYLQGQHDSLFVILKRHNVPLSPELALNDIDKKSFQFFLQS
jgi:hypothetical protein